VGLAGEEERDDEKEGARVAVAGDESVRSAALALTDAPTGADAALPSAPVWSEGCCGCCGCGCLDPRVASSTSCRSEARSGCWLACSPPAGPAAREGVEATLAAVAVAAEEAVDVSPGGSTSGSELLRWPPAAALSLARASKALRELCARALAPAAAAAR